MTLRALSREKARYESGTFDLQDWEVRLRSEDRRIGTVHDILVDDRGHTRYLDVDLDGANRHVLIPPGQMEAEGTREVIWLSGVQRDQVYGVPEYGHDPSLVDDDYERNLTAALSGSDGRSDYYDRPDYQTSWGRGRGATGDGRLAPLDRLDDIDVAKGDPDPRGFEVVGRDGKKLGKVRQLIGDVAAMKVRYLTVKLDRSVGKEDGEVLIPVGHAHVDREENRVRVPALDRERVQSLPRWDGKELPRNLETRLSSFFEESYGNERRYDHPRYRYDRLYGETPAFMDDASPEEEVGIIVVRRWSLDAEKRRGARSRGSRTDRDASRHGDESTEAGSRFR